MMKYAGFRPTAAVKSAYYMEKCSIYTISALNEIIKLSVST